MTRHWFTSDLHFGHRAIIRYSNRPYESVEEMDWDLIRRWNARITNKDHVYCLGDLSFYNQKKTEELVRRLHGQIHWVLGNHDPQPPTLRLRKRFAWVGHYKEVKPYPDGPRIVMSHYPFEAWNGLHRGTLHAHGHCHGRLQRQLPRRVDVGVDCWNLTPVSYDELIEFTSQDKNAVE